MLFQVIDKYNIHLSGNERFEVPQECRTGGEILFGSNSIITEKMRCWANGLVHMRCCQRNV
jgi:hypothetical protein